MLLLLSSGRNTFSQDQCAIRSATLEFITCFCWARLLSPLTRLPLINNLCSGRLKGMFPMNQGSSEGQMNQLSEIKKKWARMTDDDFLEVEGDMDKLSGRIQEEDWRQEGRHPQVA